MDQQNLSLAPSPSASLQANGASDPNQFGEYSGWAQEELAKGFTPEQLHQTLAENGMSINPQPSPESMAANGTTSGKKSGNWFTHLLPTIGSMALPALGAFLAPETGGLSLLASAGLSGLGAAGGKVAENATEGKSPVDQSVLSEGITGAAGGAAGGVVGKVLGKGAKFLGGQADKIATEKAATTGAQDAIDTAANTYKDIPPALQKAYNAKDSLAHVTNMGYDIADPTNLTHVANTSNDVLNDVLNRALATSGPVDLSHYPQLIKDALTKRAGTLGGFDKVALARGRLGYSNTPSAQLLQQLEDLGAGVAKTGSDPNELRTLTTKLGQMAQDAKPTVTAATGAVDPKQRAIYDTINEVRDNLKKSLYERPEVSDALKGEIGNLEANPEMNITPELANHLNSVITGAGKGTTSKSAAQDILDEISRNINIANMGRAGGDVGQIVTSTGGKARAAAEAGLGEAGAADHPILDQVGNFVNPHAGMVTTAVKGAAHAAKNPAILETLSRIGAMGSKLAPAVGAGAATIPNMAAAPVPVTGADGMPGATMGGSMNANSTMGGVQPDPNNLSSILSEYMRMGTVDPYLLSATSPVVQALAPEVQKQKLISAQLSGIPESFANAGGAQGAGGIVSRVSGLIPGTAAHTYQQQQAGAAQALASLLGISPDAAQGLLPQLMQNQDTAGINSGILSSMAGQLAH